MSQNIHIVAVCQMTSTNKIEENLDTCISLIDASIKHGAKIVFLPEACDFIAESRAEALKLAEPLDGRIVKTFQELARSFRIWLSVGGIHQKVSPRKVRNAHLIIDDKGDLVRIYHKTHLCDVDLPERNLRIRESDYIEQGENLIPPVATPVGNVGLSICYDVRFPELSLALRGMGADILTFPSAFALNTGARHWDVLLRARAIETQCYVVAAAQTGVHNPRRSSWGHAMVVDPWGTTIAECSEGETVAVALIDLDMIKSVRSNMPVWAHRRNDLYPPILGRKIGNIRLPDINKAIVFGEIIVKPRQIFYQTNTSFAFTSPKCLVAGHVLVAAKRCVQRLPELTGNEVSDLFQAVARVQKAVESFTHATASLICVQDGEHAGQIVEHVHVHVMPRKPGDARKNTDFYSALRRNTAAGIATRSERSLFAEATKLRKFFYK